MAKQDLTVIKGTYSKALVDNLEEIYSAYESSDYNVERYRQLVIDTVKSVHDTPAKINFLDSLAKARTKDNILMLVSNVALRAAGLSTNVDDKWANEKR